MYLGLHVEHIQRLHPILGLKPNTFGHLSYANVNHVNPFSQRNPNSWAQSFVLVFQFVDDAFILRSSVSGVLKVNQALQEFSDKFRHRFKGGSKRAAVLYEAKRGWSLLTSCMSWAQPFKTLQLQLDASCARCMALTAELSERYPA